MKKKEKKKKTFWRTHLFPEVFSIQCEIAFIAGSSEVEYEVGGKKCLQWKLSWLKCCCHCTLILFQIEKFSGKNGPRSYHKHWGRTVFCSWWKNAGKEAKKWSKNFIVTKKVSKLKSIVLDCLAQHTNGQMITYDTYVQVWYSCSSLSKYETENQTISFGLKGFWNKVFYHVFIVRIFQMNEIQKPKKIYSRERSILKCIRRIHEYYEWCFLSKVIWCYERISYLSIWSLVIGHWSYTYIFI